MLWNAVRFSQVTILDQLDNARTVYLAPTTRNVATDCISIPIDTLGTTLLRIATLATVRTRNHPADSPPKSMDGHDLEFVSGLAVR